MKIEDLLFFLLLVHFQVISSFFHHWDYPTPPISFSPSSSSLRNSYSIRKLSSSQLSSLSQESQQPQPEWIIGVAKEHSPRERRVALTPQSVAFITQTLQLPVLIESGAGEEADYTNEQYETQGGIIVTQKDLWKNANLVVNQSPLSFPPSLLLYLSLLLHTGKS